MKILRKYSAERQLRELAYYLPFPVHAAEVMEAAQRIGCMPENISLLCEFDPDDVFENGVDFITRCDEVRLLLHEKREAPRELLRSPQD